MDPGHNMDGTPTAIILGCKPIPQFANRNARPRMGAKLPPVPQSAASGPYWTDRRACQRRRVRRFTSVLWTFRGKSSRPTRGAWLAVVQLVLNYSRVQPKPPVKDRRHRAERPIRSR